MVEADHFAGRVQASNRQSLAVDDGPGGGVVVGVDEGQERLRLQLLERPAQDPLPGRVEPGERAASGDDISQFRLGQVGQRDLQTLSGLMHRLGVTRNPAKQVTTWVLEKASRVKLSGLSAGSEQLGIYLSLETLSLGVEGKAALWTALREIKAGYPELQSVDLDHLIERAQQQRAILERQRIVVAPRALRNNA